MNSTSEIPADDQEFLDWAFDSALQRIEDGKSVIVDELLHGRDSLRDDVIKTIRLAEEVARGVGVVHAAATPPPVIRGYAILRELGSGGMGNVYLARQERLGGRAVALKVLPHSVSLSPRARLRFQNEANTIAKLRHSNIVAVHDVIHDETVHAFAMGWVDGASLQLIIDALGGAEGRNGDIPGLPHADRSQPGHAGSGRMAIVSTRLGSPDASPFVTTTYEVFIARIGVAMARALGEVHRAGLLHRDIKPSNILLRRDGTPLLSDFGLVRDTDSTVTQAGHFTGTPAYASPEQLRGEIESLDARSDVFSLGATLYHALSLRRPFEGGDTAAILKQIDGGRAPSLRSLNNRVPRDLETIIAKALDADAARRYASADEFADDLERLLNLQPVRARRAGMVSRTVKLMRRNRGALIGACAGGVAAMLLALLLIVYVFIVPKWVDEHLRQAHLAMLSPAQADSMFSTEFWNIPVAERRYELGRLGEEIVPPAIANRLDAALRLQPWRTDLRRERGILALAGELARSAQAPVGGASATREATADRAAMDQTAEWADTLPETVGYALHWRSGKIMSPPDEEHVRSASAEDLRALGLLAFLCHDVDTAVLAWSRLDLLRDPDPLVEAALGQLHIARGEPTRAYPRLHSAVQAFGDVDFLIAYLAEAALAAGDVEKAGLLIERARLLDADQSLMVVPRVHAQWLAASGRWDEADEAFGLPALAGNDVARFQHALMLRSRGRIEDSLARLVQCSGRLPHTTRVAGELIATADHWWAGQSVEDRARAMLTSLKTSAASGLVFLDLLRRYAASVELTEKRPNSALHPGEDPSAYLQRASLWDIAHQMEVSDMQLWSRIVSYPDFLKTMEPVAWCAPDARSGSRLIGQLASVVAATVFGANSVNDAQAAMSCTSAPCFQGRGDLPGGAFASQAFALSDDGTTVVGSSSQSSGTDSYRWRAATGMVSLGDLPGGPFYSRAEAVSADGNVVAGSSSSTNSGGGLEAYRWTSASGLVALGDLPGGDFYSTTRAISDDGLVVVGWCNFGEARPFRWTSATGMQQFAIPGGEQGIAFATSQDGSITFGDSGPSNTNSRLFRWNSLNTFTDLGQLLGPGSEMDPYRASNDGQHVVGYACTASCVPFEWTAALGSVNLGDLPGGSTDGRALGISGNSEFVVGYSTSAAGPQAALWDPSRTIYRLADVLVLNGVAIPSGWVLKDAVGVTVVGNEVVVCGNGTNPNGQPEAWIARYAISPPSPAGLSLVPTGSCYHQGDQVVMHVDAAGLALAATGGQFFLNFDHSKLAFVSATPGGIGNPANPFDLEVYECLGQTLGGVCIPLPGRLDYAVGVTGGGPGSGTTADSTMAVLTFTALADVCNVSDLVRFRDNVSGPLIPPTRLADEFGMPIILPLNDLGPIIIDTVPPVITCPSNISINADAGFCTATLTIPNAMAVDSCDSSPTVVGTRSDAQPLNAPYPGGATTTITWTATDDCGNVSTCNQTVTVSSFNEMLVSVQLQPNISPLGTLTRCIRFELSNCVPAIGPVVVDAPIAFNVVAGIPNIASVDTMVLVPCGQYSCATARDRKHTLRRTDENFHIVGTQYVADFTGDPTSGGDWLIGGNLNDDQFIDILDFGIFVGQFGSNYTSGNTACGLVAVNADVSGDGVVTTADFTFIQINFLKFHEANCCGMLLRMAGPELGDGNGPGPGPITRISVRELIRRGMKDVAAGDVNRDGWVDQSDIAAFLHGG